MYFFISIIIASKNVKYIASGRFLQIFFLAFMTFDEESGLWSVA